jgi:hypothetical protein
MLMLLVVVLVLFDFGYFSGLVMLEFGVLLVGLLVEVFDIFELVELVVELFAILGIADVFVLF